MSRMVRNNEGAAQTKASVLLVWAAGDAAA